MIKNKYDTIHKKENTLMGTPRQDEVLDRLDRVESKLDYIIDHNKHDYSSYAEWLIDKQVNERVKNNGSIE